MNNNVGVGEVMDFESMVLSSSTKKKKKNIAEQLRGSP